MKRVVVLDVVGLTQDLLGDDTPNLSALIAEGAVRPLETITPAVTCSVQSTFVTGKPPSSHGIVGNGWYFRDLSEIWFCSCSATRSGTRPGAATPRSPAPRCSGGTTCTPRSTSP
jgi:predicted AlkP superfamily pyrophosphatase or phosphodiesterase